MRETFPTPVELKGALQGTMLYIALYAVVFIQFQSYSKFYLVSQKKKEARKKEGSSKVSFREVKYYNSRDVLALAGDRCVGNTLEWAIVFLPLLWLHALFVNPEQSFTICALYTFFRSYYPIAFMVNKSFYFSIMCSTVPCYGVLGFLFYELASKAVFV